jgi:hypothetical protein
MSVYRTAKPYRIIYYTSDDENNTFRELNEPSTPQSTGWHSAKNCKYPQEMILEFTEPIQLRQVQILSHAFKIATKIDFSVFIPNTNVQLPLSIPLPLIKFSKLNTTILDNNKRSEYKVGECKSVFLNCPALYLKLTFHKCHKNVLNKFNQVGLLTLIAFGESLNKNKPEQLDNQANMMARLDPFASLPLAPPVHGAYFDINNDNKPKEAEEEKKFELPRTETMCNFCESLCDSKLIFQNNECGHSYCLHCLNETQCFTGSGPCCPVSNCFGKKPIQKLKTFVNEHSPNNKPRGINPAQKNQFALRNELSGLFQSFNHNSKAPQASRLHPLEDSKSNISDNKFKLQAGKPGKLKILEEITPEPPVVEVLCSLCMGNYLQDLVYTNSTCTHNYCTYCIMDHHILRQKGAKEAPKCPVPECKEKAQIEQVQRFQQKLELKQKEDEMKRSGKGKATKTPMEPEDSCIICENAKKEVAFYKCGHKCCCHTCGLKFVGRPCPLCMATVADILKVYE